MTEQRIDSRPPTVRPAGAVQRAGTATDRRPRRQEAEDRRNGGDGARKRRHLYDLLFDEIDQVPELEATQRERLKRNIRAHLALRARDQTPLPTIPRPPPDDAAPAVEDEGGHHPADARAAPPHEGGVALEAEEDDHDHLIGVAAPQSPELPPEELAQNAILARQLRECLGRNSEAARKVAIYLKLLLSIDGALSPHVVIDI